MVLQVKNKIPAFDSNHLISITKVLADTNSGLTGSELGHALSQAKIPDIDPLGTKWKRLYNAFASFQNKHQIGNHVILFINYAMNPARYTSNPNLFTARQQDLNAILAFAGMNIGNDGKIRHVSRAENLDAAAERANKFKAQLQQRNVHQDIFKFCTPEILAQNYFHAVFEAMKSITSKIRTLSGLSSDGVKLVQGAFSLGGDMSPVCAINTLSTETEIGEQKGFVNLLIGMYGTIRNPLGHNPKIEWNMTEQDTLDMLTMISLVHRKLDEAYPYKKP